MDESAQTGPPRPKLWGPKRRWLVLLALVLALAGVLAAQRLTAHSIPTGHWTPSELTPPTREEQVWYVLPSVSLMTICMAFGILTRRLVPEEL